MAGVRTQGLFNLNGDVASFTEGCQLPEGADCLSHGEGCFHPIVDALLAALIICL